MEEEEGDPFFSLIKRCKPTSSQEDILRTCPFARQSEFFPGDDDSQLSEPFGIPVDPTGIVMVSPPEDFQTPPEDSLPASSVEQRPPAAAAVNAGAGPKSVGGAETMAVDELVFTDAERAVDLGKDSDNNLGFSGVNCTQGVDSAGGGVLGVDPSRFETESEELGVLPSGSSLAGSAISLGSVPKRLKLSKYFGGCDPPVARTANNDAVITETNRGDNNAGTEVLDVEVEGVDEELGEDTVFVELPLRETVVDIAQFKGTEVFKKGNEELGRKNIEDLDKFKYVSQKVRGGGGGGGGRRELPPSIRQQEKNEGPGASASKDRILKGLLDALKMVAGELGGGGGSEEDVDILETAKRHGLTLPRPRWWPPEEGYDD